jgi:hypothetical protein
MQWTWDRNKNQESKEKLKSKNFLLRKSKNKAFIALGTFTTVFQAEVWAIMA